MGCGMEEAISILMKELLSFLDGQDMPSTTSFTTSSATLKGAENEQK
jgi:hypothetical protein